MKLLKLVCIVLVAGATSCSSVRYATVPVNYAPKLVLGRDTAHILIINRLAFDSISISNKKKLSVLRSAAYSAVVSAEKLLKLLPNIRVTNLADSIPFTVNTDSITLLAANYKAGYVLTLDSFTADIVLDSIDGDGSERTAYYNTKARVEFTLYENNGTYFKKLKGAANDPQSEGSYQGILAELLIHPTIKGNRSFVNEAARNASSDALKDYLPYTITHERPLYNGTDELASAVQQIQMSKFDVAYKILNPLIDGADVKLASKAAYNLAVVYEAQGDIDEALDLAKLSNQKQQNNYATALIGELIKE